MLLFVSSQQKQSPECQAQVQDQKKGGDQAVEARNIQDSLCLFLDVSVYFWKCFITIKHIIYFI